MSKHGQTADAHYRAGVAHAKIAAAMQLIVEATDQLDDEQLDDLLHAAASTLQDAKSRLHAVRALRTEGR